MLDLVSPCMFRDSITDDNLQAVAWPRGRSEMQTRGSQTRYPTAGSALKRGCATSSYLGDAGDPQPEVLSMLDINGSFDEHSWLFVALPRLSTP